MSESKEPKFNVWLLDADIYIRICDLALEHGKKEGESIEQEFLELLEKEPERFYLLGYTDKDIDLLTGEMREAGIKVYNSEEERRRKTK